MSHGTAIPKAILEVIEHDGSRRTVPISQSPFLIGRGVEAGNHLQLTDSRISRSCAAVVCTDGTFHLEDRGSRHGLFVNGKKMEPGPLREGDTITFGVSDSCQLVFRAGPVPRGLLLPPQRAAVAVAPASRFEVRHQTQADGEAAGEIHRGVLKQIVPRAGQNP